MDPRVSPGSVLESEVVVAVVVVAHAGYLLQESPGLWR
jgi:hypothetical protein